MIFVVRPAVLLAWSQTTDGLCTVASDGHKLLLLYGSFFVSHQIMILTIVDIQRRRKNYTS